MALLCHCFRVNDRKVRDEAARGVTCPEELGAVCGAGTRCGGCVESLRAVLSSYAGTAPAGIAVAVG